MKASQRIIMAVLVLAILFSFLSCGKKTPLFFNDRATSSGIKYSAEDKK